MAAITSINLPHVSGWTNFAAGGFQNDGSGNSEPTSRAADRGAVYDTVVTEDSTNYTTGTIFRVTFDDLDGTPWDDGAIWRVVYDFSDENNYRYVKVLWGGLTPNADTVKDNVQLWKVVSGTHSQVTPDTVTGSHYLALEPGDLRHYQLRKRSTTFYPKVTIMTCKDQHLVKVSAYDRLDHDRDIEDWTIMSATDTRTVFNGKVGLVAVSSSNTIVVKAVQHQQVSCYWTAKTGNDSNSGSHTSPFLTLAKLVNTVPTNGYGFVKSGTYRESLINIGSGSGFINPATSTNYEDAMHISTYSNNTVLWETAGGNGCLYIKGLEKGFVFRGFDMDGREVTTGVGVIYLWAQAAGGSGATPKYFRFQDGKVRRGKDIGANVFFQHGTFSGTPTTAEYEQFHECIDMEISHCADTAVDAGPGAPNGSHGMYMTGSKYTIEYCYIHNNSGVGAKFSIGSIFASTYVTNDNIFRFCRSTNNAFGGLETYNSDRCIIDYNLCWDEAYYREYDGAIFITSGTKTVYIRNNVVLRNAFAGTESAGIIIRAGSPATATVPGPFYIDGNSTHGCRNGINFYATTGSFTTVNLYNNVFYNSAVNDIRGTGNITTYNNGNNHVTADGDPLFNNPAGNDLSIQASSPLIEAGAVQAFSHPFDFDLRPRPQDNGTNSYDIGAYEYPEPNANDPILTTGSPYDLTAGVSKTLTGISVADSDGDADEAWGVCDNVTTGFTGTASGTGTFVGADVV